MANISAINFGGSIADTRPYGTCSTTVSTKAKTVAISDFELYEGASVLVKFNNGNSAASPTLNVNNTGAKTIRFNGSAISNSLYYSWSSGAVLEFVYDGTYWNLMTTCNTNTDNDTDTKNTAGSTDTNDKIYLIGATSQAANPQTYSHDTAYVGSDGYLYSNSTKVDMSKLDEKADIDLTSTLISQGTDIPSNADLNTIDYLKIGVYTCKLQSTAATLKNCPVSNGFRMEVYSYQSSNTDDGILTTAQYVYRLRKIIKLSGEQYYQFVNSTTLPGVFTYGDWQYIPTTKATIDTTDTNGSTVTNGDASTPVYINSAGKFAACTGVYSDSKSCIPNSSLNYDLGSSTRLFSTTYTRYIDTASGYNLRLKAADTEHMNMYGGNVNTTAHIIPTVNNTYNLGSGDYKWKNIYASNFIENGANINTIYADKSYADYCSSYLHSANRAQFCKPAGVTIEYSTDGGSTWIDYGATDDQKVGFFSGISQNFTLGKSISTKATSSDMLRITMDATAMGVYISCKCLLLNVSTNGSSNFNVKVEKSMKGSADTFGTFIESQTLTGWSGWNRIPIGYNFGGGNTQNYNIAKLRLTFSSDGAGSSYTSGAHAYVLDMEVLGNTYWTIPHTMAKTGHLYTWDVKGNAIFNESVTAKNIYPNNGIVFAGTDSDRNLIRIGGNVNETIDSKSKYGYTLKYLGLGSGVNNALALYADNETADEQILGTKWLNDGTMYSRNILPHDNNIYFLGSSSLKWKNIYATTFTGHLAGTVNMTGATNDAYRNILVTNGSNGICYSSAGNAQLNYATGDIKATSFTGNLTGNVTGNLTGDVNGNVTGNLTGDVNGNASSATNASNIYINTTTESSYYPMTFVTTTSAGNTKLYIGGSTGTTSSGSGIRYNPNAKTCYCSGGFYEASDERLKNFGNDIEVDLDKLSKLSKKYFTWKDDESNTQHIGVSAQEVQAIYPELVEVIDEEGHLSVSYDKLSVVALKGIDVLNDKVKSLEERLERLEKIING